MAHPGRKVHAVLPQFVGTNVVKPIAEQRAELLAFVAEEYPADLTPRADRTNPVGEMWICASRDTWASRPDGRAGQMGRYGPATAASPFS